MSRKNYCRKKKKKVKFKYAFPSVISSLERIQEERVVCGLYIGRAAMSLVEIGSVKT